jgi:DNA adenine methylase
MTTYKPGGKQPFLSPLRYPGGKARLASFIELVIAAQPRRPKRYVEPFAGGAGIALRLLYDDVVDEVVINDLDAGVAAFWRAVVHHNVDLATRVARCRPSMKQWHQHRQTYVDGHGDDVELGFATFFLNRTNRSGIVRGRPIGGLEQTGKWGLTARFNAGALAERIRNLAKYGDRITVCEQDGIEVIERERGERGSFLYVDPPYIEKARGLYLDTFEWADHQALAQSLRRGGRWLVTYERDRRVLDLYPDLACASFGIAHTAADPHVGREYAVFSRALTIPSSIAWLGHNARFAANRRPA